MNTEMYLHTHIHRVKKERDTFKEHCMEFSLGKF